MNGSKFRLLAWSLPLLVAIALLLRLHELRTEIKRLSPPGPPPATSGPPPPPALPERPSARVTEEAQALAHLQQELARLRARIATREHQVRPTRVARTVPDPLTLKEAFLPAEAWRDVGTASPAALAETALWAGAGGDVQRMAGLLSYDADALADANALFDRLPAELRPPGTDGRALIALLSTDAVPLSEAKLVGDFPTASGEHILLIQFAPAPDAPAGTPGRNVKLTARQQPNSTEWSLVVPSSAVAHLATELGMPPRP